MGELECGVLKYSKRCSQSKVKKKQRDLKRATKWWPSSTSDSMNHHVPYFCAGSVLRICPFPSGRLAHWGLDRVSVPIMTSKQKLNGVNGWLFILCYLVIVMGVIYLYGVQHKIKFSPAWLWEQFQVSDTWTRDPYDSLNSENNEIRLIIAVKAPENIQVRH